jgi:hypothetical protein
VNAGNSSASLPAIPENLVWKYIVPYRVVVRGSQRPLFRSAGTILAPKTEENDFF